MVDEPHAPNSDSKLQDAKEDEPVAVEYAQAEGVKDDPRPQSDQVQEAPQGKPASFASLWEAAYQPPKNYLRVKVAAALLVALAVAAAPVFVWFQNIGPPTFTVPKIDVGFELRPKTQDWQADAIAAQHEAMPWDPVLGLVRKRPSSENPTPSATRGRATARRAPQGQAKGELPTVAPPERSVYADFWGPADRYAAASSKASTRGGRQTSDGPAIAVKGSVLSARLQDQVAGSPSGADVIAVLSHKKVLGNVALPGGTQMHGTVTGADDSRVFVSFSFARFSDGRTLAVSGSARDEQGRLGIPGKKLFTSKSAGSVGLASATRALQAAGRELAGTAGAIIGAGVEGATDSGVDKARRADRDEYVLIAKPGTPFQIYVQAVEAKNG